jgi:hypothetical protein
MKVAHPRQKIVVHNGASWRAGFPWPILAGYCFLDNINEVHKEKNETTWMGAEGKSNMDGCRILWEDE